MVQLSRNWFDVRPGDPGFSVGNNICDYFELGKKDGVDYWLDAQIVGAGEFIFNGRIFLAGGGGSGTGLCFLDIALSRSLHHQVAAQVTFASSPSTSTMPRAP